MKSRKQKRLLAIVLAGIMMFSLAGCGSGVSSEPVADSDSAGAGETSSPAQETTDAQVSFVFAEHVANVEEQSPAVYAVVQEYMKQHPNVTITLQGTTTDEHIRNMKMAAQSNSLPELFWMEQGGAVEMANAGILADITEDITGDQAWVDNFLPGVLDSMKIDGKIYGIPCELQSNGIWMNKALFDEYGLEMPATYEEFLNCAKVFNDNGIIPLAQGAKDTFTAWAFENMHCRFGFFDHIDGIIEGSDQWNNPDYLKFYEKLEDMRNNNVFSPNVSNLNYAQSVEEFLAGEAAMLNSGVWDTKKFDQSDLANDVYYWWGPTFSDGVGTQEVSMKAPAHPYVVSAKVKEEQPEVYAAIIDFLKFFYSEEGTTIIARDNQSIPVTKYSGEIDSEKYPVFARVMERMNDDWASPAVCPDMYISGQLINQYRESMIGVVNGTYTPEEALKFMDEQQSIIQ
ncbi:ABC transporter substrate-binding protein [Kineothrix sp. MB12-C1]|uniref:ABC transporter substrate-binding protein n=1 Tax=Kineothrix sp. MB12-C1 TaxID=3070215 RepID=UPI0027D1F228|nr:extracellular solute-binding protein [Kineothrix sp. MB12-C1]WMC93342.1 extracellular solute-binding protein [Kineothrix sp. MB12-C1]